ncbi:toll/interleukin-1 receptor domain-containing protein [Archangium lipolyticum]|uniref:toll/interleukin-1 receptor domain-containing protein n=1 Tax=Archangium lipolyticum TaxID=2970465 RepID=UPI00214A71EB|nr:TIR domain-containing protein [Archangium lipolyticum]
MARIFVSYRREDSPGHTGRLYDHLVAHFGERLVFRDIEAIAPGADFVRAIEEAVSSCGVLLVVIGPQWINARDKQGRRRLDNPGDFVRLEVAAALSRNVRVIPVLVGGATFPSEEELPPALAPLARRNAIEISDPRFRTDMANLIGAIQAALGGGRPPGEPTPGPGAQWRRWGAVGFVIALTVVVFSGILWVWERAPKPTDDIGGAGDAGVAEGLAPARTQQEEAIGGAGDAGVSEELAPARTPQEAIGGAGDAGVTPSGTARTKKRTSRSSRGDAGVVQPPLDAGSDAGVVQPPLDAGSDAGVVQPPLDAGSDAGVMQSPLDAGSDAGVVQPPLDAGSDAGVMQPPLDAGSDAGVVQPPLDAGSDAGVVQPPLDAGSDAGVVQPPLDAGTMDEDGGTAELLSTAARRGALRRLLTSDIGELLELEPAPRFQEPPVISP